MTILRGLTGLFLIAVLGLAAPSQGQDLRVMLDLERHQALPEDALSYYNRALERADRIDYQGAVEDLARAAELAPNHIELQFLLEKWSRYMAEITYGEDSLKNFDYAETALRRLLANSTLGPEERTRALRESQKISEGKNSLRARDEQRLKDGMNLVLTIQEQRLERTGDAGSEKLLEQRRSRDQQEEEEQSVSPWSYIVGELTPGSGGMAGAVAGAAAGAAGGGVPDPFAVGEEPIADDPFAAGGFGGDAGGGFDPFAQPVARRPAAAAPQPQAPPPPQRPAREYNPMEDW